MVRSKRIFQKSCSIKIQNQDISFLLKKSSHRKTLAISIDEKAKINVSAPLYLADKDIYVFIQEKGHWILEKLKEAQKNKDFLDNRIFEQGNAFLFLGKKYKLNIVEKAIKQSKVEFDGNAWSIYIPEGLKKSQRLEKIRMAMVKWYRTQAQEVLGGRVFYYGRLLGKEPQKIVVKTQKRMWGCCNYHTQSIYLNWQIILSPLEVLDYVVVHELCHLFEPNHSQRFWSKVESILPDYKSRKKWLKNHYLDMVLT